MQTSETSAARPLNVAIVAEGSTPELQLQRAMAEEHGIQLNQAKRLSDLPTQASENGRPNVVIVWHTKLNDMEYADLLRVSRRATIVVALRRDDLLQATNLLSLVDAWLFVDEQLPLTAEVARLSLDGYCLVPPFMTPSFTVTELRLQLLASLTPTEQQVLALLGEGKSNRTISEELDMTEANVKYVVRSLLGKLQLRNRTEAAVFAAIQAFVPAARSYETSLN
ncbi:MAG: helix-turn-helix transcriptional regulator [Pseudomonadota bacterium]